MMTSVIAKVLQNKCPHSFSEKCANYYYATTAVLLLGRAYEV
jgi:hypothetical protein